MLTCVVKLTTFTNMITTPVSIRLGVKGLKALRRIAKKTGLSQSLTVDSLILKYGESLTTAFLKEIRGNSGRID